MTNLAHQRMTRYAWPAPLLILVSIYCVYNARPDWLDGGPIRPIKYQRDTDIDGGAINTGSSSSSSNVDQEQPTANIRPGQRERNSLNSTIEVKFERRENIVYPIVDVTRFPKIDEEECPNMLNDVMVAPNNSMPLTALASFPRSGNSWTRSLIQVATQYSTGSVHWEWEKERERVQEWFKAGTEDYKLRKGIVVKTHNFSPEHISEFDNGAIMLIRNPYYSVVSDYFRLFRGRLNMSLSNLVDSMQSKKDHWMHVLLPQFTRWKTTNINWMTNCKRLLVVFFEDLEENPVAEITRMVAFLGRPLSPDRILCAAHNFAPIKAHRSQMDFDPYTGEMHAILDGFISEVNQTLIAKGAKPLPTYEKYLLS